MQAEFPYHFAFDFNQPIKIGIENWKIIKKKLANELPVILLKIIFEFSDTRLNNV